MLLLLSLTPAEHPCFGQLITEALALMPATAFTGLSVEQIEALLAHELAHVRRHDYLVNLFQTVAETLLFYHPAVWWVSRSIRKVASGARVRSRSSSLHSQCSSSSVATGAHGWQRMATCMG